jgi:hypothetical protein
MLPTMLPAKDSDQDQEVSMALVVRRSVGEALALVGIVLCIPFVILAIGLPIVLFVRLLSWVGGML